MGNDLISSWQLTLGLSSVCFLNRVPPKQNTEVGRIGLRLRQRASPDLPPSPAGLPWLLGRLPRGQGTQPSKDDFSRTRKSQRQAI